MKSVVLHATLGIKMEWGSAPSSSHEYSTRDLICLLGHLSLYCTTGLETVFKRWWLTCQHVECELSPIPIPMSTVTSDVWLQGEFLACLVIVYHVPSEVHLNKKIRPSLNS